MLKIYNLADTGKSFPAFFLFKTNIPEGLFLSQKNNHACKQYKHG